MGTQDYLDYSGDAPDCAATLKIAYELVWSKFPKAIGVRLQYRAESTKGGWNTFKVGPTATSYALQGLLPSTKYEYRFVVKTTGGRSKTTTSTFST